MMKRVLSFAWSVRREFVKYFFVGISGFILDLGSLMLLKQVFGFSAVAAVVVNQPVVLLYNFSLNKWWSFRNRALPYKQIVKYLSIAILNYFFSVTAMYVLHDVLYLDYRLARVVTVAAMVPVNFLLYKYWVYRPDPGTQFIHSPGDTLP